MEKKPQLSPWYMLLLFLGTIFFSLIYYFLGRVFSKNPLSYYQYFVFTCVLAIVIVGGYQIFFWIQRHNYYFTTRCLKCKLDDYIPFLPEVVWIYSFSYYILIGLVVVSIPSIEQGIIYIFGGLLLLFFQSIFFLIFPCVVPKKWRDYQHDSISTKLLRFVQGYDNGRNCFPSMHCSVATYAGLILVPVFSYYAWALITLVAISCLFVKQHQIADIAPGILLGALVHALIL